MSHEVAIWLIITGLAGLALSVCAMLAGWAHIERMFYSTEIKLTAGGFCRLAYDLQYTKSGWFLTTRIRVRFFSANPYNQSVAVRLPWWQVKQLEDWGRVQGLGDLGEMYGAYTKELSQ